MISFDSERDMESFFKENEEYFLQYFGLPDHQLHRQVNLYPYGTCDLLAVNRLLTSEDQSTSHFDIHIFELKNTKFDYKHIGQCARYKRFFEVLGVDSQNTYEVRVSLIGLKTFPNDNDLVFIAQDVDWLDVYEIQLSPTKGVDFKCIEGWQRGNLEDINQDQLNASLFGEDY